MPKVKRYREEFKEKQGGIIGITLNMDWRCLKKTYIIYILYTKTNKNVFDSMRHPLTEKAEDIAAAQRALDWQLGWFADPIWKGDYPESMRKRCGDRLPSFSEEEKELIKGTSEFFGLTLGTLAESGVHILLLKGFAVQVFSCLLRLLGFGFFFGVCVAISP